MFIKYAKVELRAPKETDNWRSRHRKDQRESISIHLVQFHEDLQETKDRSEAKISGDKQRKLQKQLEEQRVPIYQQNMYPDLFILTYPPLPKNQLKYVAGTYARKYTQYATEEEKRLR